MAEGLQIASFNTKYYCHQCSREVAPFCSAELICPDCSTGFLEEVSKNLYEAEVFAQNSDDNEYESDHDADDDLSLIAGFDMDSLMTQMLLSVPESEEPDTPEESFFPEHSLGGLLSRIGTLNAARDLSPSRFEYFHEFGDDEEMDALASQLLDEVEISGPPPLSKEQIKFLPVVVLAKEHIEKGLQCTVCMDDFSMREKAKELPCTHLFHEKCIVPWLERQSTCPNCREVIEPPSRSKRSRSCPRTSRYTSRGNTDSRRFSEAPSISDFFTTSRNPFRFLN